jgi:hypothetical protein
MMNRIDVVSWLNFAGGPALELAAAIVSGAGDVIHPALAVGSAMDPGRHLAGT